MLKAGSPVVVLFFSYIFGLENPSLAEMSIVAFVTLGVAIASIGELHFSVIGIFSLETSIILSIFYDLYEYNFILKIKSTRVRIPVL
jgi:hypothetical protein